MIYKIIKEPYENCRLEYLTDEKGIKYGLCIKNNEKTLEKLDLKEDPHYSLLLHKAPVAPIKPLMKTSEKEFIEEVCVMLLNRAGLLVYDNSDKYYKLTQNATKQQCYLTVCTRKY